MIDKNEFKLCFSSLHASAECLEEVLKMTENRKNEYKPRSLRGGRMALIAAALAFVLAVTVAAAEYLDTNGILDAFFGEDEYSSQEAYTETESGIWQGATIEGWYTQGEPYLKQYEYPAWNAVPISDEMKEILAPCVYELGQSTVYGDYTLSVKACMYSANTESGIIYYTLENPNGVKNYELGRKGNIIWTDYDGVRVTAMTGFEYVDSANTTDTKLSVCFFFCCAEPNLEMSHLEGWNEKRPRIRLAGGEDSIYPANLEYTITVDTYDLGLPALSAADGSIQMSPIGMRIYQEELGLEPYETIAELKLVFRDGSEYIIRSGADNIDEAYFALKSGGHVENSYVNYVFNRVVDLEQLESVVIDGVSYPTE